ncbi:hypothetical protein [Silvanigrella paludirubra]|uniref:hypothetical protein n=1 Tax=Silvanigrella paludirubra TaxID=2499159 RepID=UPI00192A2497|nr:hypothetical protein [Silvanigrella paludirubra]
MFTDQLQFPFALILTHRRGVGIIICKNNSELKSLIQNKSGFTNILNSKINLIDSNIEYFLKEKTLFSRVIGKTAENLFTVYQRSLEIVSLTSQDIKTIIVGVGPGSFTGLRLGCAFVNGLKTGANQLNLLPVSTYLTNELLDICKINHCEFECKQQLGDFDLDDESTGFITFFDLYFSLKKAWEDKRNYVESLSPEYGKEPGPVLKLREGNNL